MSHQICGTRKEETTFVVTGPAKGHYAVNVCTENVEHGGKHRDDQTGKSWN